MAAKIRPVRLTRGNVDVVRDFRVIFLKLAPSRDFETSSCAVKKHREDFGSLFPASLVCRRCHLPQNVSCISSLPDEGLGARGNSKQLQWPII